MKAYPDVHTYCACGAQWHGKYAIDNPYIGRHADRRGFYGDHRCRLISLQDFVALFPSKRKRKGRIFN